MEVAVPREIPREFGSTDPSSRVLRIVEQVIAPAPTDRSSRARRLLNRIALAGVAIWLAVFGLLPIVHSIDHQDDHVHLPGGGIVYRAPEPASTPAPIDHGADQSLAHFGAALIALPFALAIVWCARRLIGDVSARPIVAPFSLAPLAVRSRGPPSRALFATA